MAESKDESDRPIEPQRRLSLSDRIYFFREYAAKIFVDVVDNILGVFYEMISFIGGFLGTGLSEFLSRLVNFQRRSIWLLPVDLLRIVIGVTFVIIMTSVLTAVAFIGGGFSAIFGFRNNYEYSLKEQIAVWIFPVAIVLSAPLWLSEYGIFKASLVAALAIAVAGLDILYGQCGILSLGQSGFLLSSAYLTTWLCNGMFGYNFPFLVSVLAGALLNGLVGIALGIPAIRVKDHYLVIISLTFSIAIPKLLKARQMIPYSGLREGGLFLRDFQIPAFMQSVPLHVIKYYMVIIPCLILLFIAYNVIYHSQIGRAFRALKCDHEISMILGIPPVSYKMRAFALSAIYAGFAGGLLVMINGLVSPDSYPSFLAIDYVVANIVGGPGTILGTVLGGSFLAFEPDLTNFVADRLPGGRDLARASYGLILILTIFFAPRGVAGLVSGWFKSSGKGRTRRGKFQLSPPPDYDYLNERKAFFKAK